jgi:cytochrome c nitrite reductase small subunit
MFPGYRWLAATLLAGVLGGVGTFTFHYADGLSYFSTDPAACANCHIMNDEYAAWQRGPHRAGATCVDCHLPHSLVSKLLAKGEHGYRHSKGFTLQDFHEPIQITPADATIVQDNCVRCHGEFVHEIVVGAAAGGDSVRCAQCHSRVGHGARG